MVLIPRFTSMKSSHSVAALLARVHLLLRWMPSLLLLLPPFTGSASAEGVAWVLDDYSDPKLNRYGVERLLIDDRTAGSKSKATLSCEKGILRVQGTWCPVAECPHSSARFRCWPRRARREI